MRQGKDVLPHAVVTYTHNGWVRLLQITASKKVFLSRGADPNRNGLCGPAAYRS
jgi:hypothetical protein